MGNFNNVTMGTGAMTYAGVDIGFLKGNVEYTYGYDVKQFKTGVPKKLQGQIVAELSAGIKASYAELTAENVAMTLGGLAITTTTSATVTKADADNVQYTFQTDPANGLQFIQLLGPGTSYAVSALKTPDGTTTYGAAKYVVMPNSGRVYALVTGTADIPTGATVRALFSYNPLAGKRINLGTQFSLPAAPVQFTHIRPQTGKQVIIYMPKAVVNGQVKLTFDEENFIVNDIEFNAVEDQTNPTFPFGYYFEQQ